MDIIILALARWDGEYSSTSFSLAKEFSKTHRVFYIDNPFTIKYFLTHLNSPQVRRRWSALLLRRKIYTRIKSVDGDLVAVTPGLTIPVNFLPAGRLYDSLQSANDAILARTISKMIRDHHVDKYLFINLFNPFYLRSFPPFFKPVLFVYISVDDIAQSRHVNRHGPRLEDEMIRKAQITLTTSKELRALKSRLSPNTYHLPNAADVALFRKSVFEDLSKPDEISEVNGPIIIYTGNIDERIDFELLKYLLNRFRHCTFVMVGPVSIERALLAPLAAYPNMIFTGKKQLEELPHYLRYASCAIIPFKCNTLTRSIYPLKINEYLAAGRPVVSTSFSDDINDFKGIIFIGQDYEGFSTGVSSALSDNSPERVESRSKFVENNTWAARVTLFWKIVRKHLADHN